MYALTERPLPVSSAMLDDTIAANAYDAMRHNPTSFEVELSYLHFRHETLRQWHELPSWLIVSFHEGAHDYPDSAAMFDDIDSGHLWTRLSIADRLPIDHPMNLELPRTEFGSLVLNDVFRAVHDVNGHYRAHEAGLTASFGPIGERNAWLTHRRQYSDAALPALWCETRGQSAWVNAFADHADMPLPNRPFATQKAGMPPRNLV